MTNKTYVRFFFNFEGIKKDHLYPVDDVIRDFESDITSYYFKSADDVKTVVRVKKGETGMPFEIIESLEETVVKNAQQISESLKGIKDMYAKMVESQDKVKL